MSQLDKTTSNTLPILLMIGAIFFFSSMDATAKVAMGEMGTLQTIWARYMSQTLLVTFIILPRIKTIAKTKYPKLQVARSIVLMMATTLFFFSISSISLAEATAIMDVNPVLITLGAFLFLGEKIGPRRVVGIVVSLIGALIVIRPGAGVFTIYAVLPLIAAVCYSAYNLATRFVGKDESPWTSLFYSAMVGAICYSAYIVFHWTPMTWTAVGLMALMGVFGTVGQLMLIKSLSMGEASLLAPFAYTGLIFSTIFGFVIFSDFPDMWTILGASIIVIAGIYVWLREQVTKAS